MKTNFSFDIQYAASSRSSQAERDQVMANIGQTLQDLLREQDQNATVAVSDSHRGQNNKLVELTSTLGDAQIAQILKSFSAQHDVLVTTFD